MILLVYFITALLTIALIVRGVSAIFSENVRRSIVRYAFGYAALLLLVLGVWFLPWGVPAGALAATWDANDGRFRLQSTPVSGPLKLRIVFSRILNDRYGIRSVPLHGCSSIVSKNQIRFDSVYDAVMIAAIKRHFDHDILAECEEAARQETGIASNASDSPGVAGSDKIVERRVTKEMIEQNSVVFYMSRSGNRDQESVSYAAPLEVVLATPAWEGFPNDPPLTVSQAVEIARRWQKQNGIYAPNIYAVNLWEKPRTSKRWAYTIFFDPNTDQKMTKGGAPGFVTVLFDGTVVGPAEQ